MERLIDDCIIMDYGSILIQKPVPQLLDTFRRYTFRLEAGAPETLPVDGKLYHSAVIRGSGETYSFADEAYVGEWLTRSGYRLQRSEVRKNEPGGCLYRADRQILRFTSNK